MTESTKNPEQIAQEGAAAKAAAEKEQQEKEAAEAQRLADEEAAAKAAEVNEFGIEVGKDLSFAEVLQMQRKMEAKHGPAEAPAGQPVKTQLKRARGG